MRSGGLTPSDPGAAVELLAFNASVQRVGEQTGHQFLLPRGSLERGGVGPFSRGLVRYPRARQSWFATPRVGSLPSSEAKVQCVVEGLGRETSSEEEIAPRVRGGSDGPHCLSWAVGRVRSGPL